MKEKKLNISFLLPVVSLWQDQYQKVMRGIKEYGDAHRAEWKILQKFMSSSTKACDRPFIPNSQQLIELLEEAAAYIYKETEGLGLVRVGREMEIPACYYAQYLEARLYIRMGFEHTIELVEDYYLVEVNGMSLAVPTFNFFRDILNKKYAAG